jgi:excisionase family DNA binding protein
MDDQSLTPLLVRVEEAARLLSLSRSTLYELLASGQIPRVKLGASVRIPTAALQEWVAKNTEYGA